MHLGAATLTVDPDTATLPSWDSGFAMEQWGLGVSREPSEILMISFELAPNWTLAQEQVVHLRKRAARLLDLREHNNAELGLILPSHCNLQCTAAMEPCPRHLPAAVADAQHADTGWGHLRCLPSLRARAPCRHQAQQVLGEGGPEPHTVAGTGEPGAAGCCEAGQPPAAGKAQE